jgi:opacity protein-like surface antigen
LIVSIATLPAAAEDTVVFKNGDVLNGTVTRQDAEHVFFQSPTLGAIKLRTEDIKEVKSSPEPQAAGQPAPEAQTEKAEAAVLPAAKADANTAADASKPKKNEEPAKTGGKWSGQAGLAIAVREKTDSNSNGVYKEDEFKTYRIYGHVNWAHKKNNLRWNWTYRYSEDETRKRDDYLNLSQNYRHTLDSGYYTETKTVYQRDYNRNIDNEFLQTAEVGRKWFDLPKFKFATSIGGGYHAYERSHSGDTMQINEPKFIFDESMEWKMISSLKLFQKYTHLGDLDQYHFVFSTGLENTLVRNLFLRLEYRLDRDTDTNYDNKGFYDKALLTSLLYKF